MGKNFAGDNVTFGGMSSIRFDAGQLLRLAGEK